MKAFAINTVHVGRTPGKTNENGKTIRPAEVEIVPAGSIFDCTKDQLKEFEAVGAARAATRRDLVDAEDDDLGEGAGKGGKAPRAAATTGNSGAGAAGSEASGQGTSGSGTDLAGSGSSGQ